MYSGTATFPGTKRSMGCAIGSINWATLRNAAIENSRWRKSREILFVAQCVDGIEQCGLTSRVYPKSDTDCT